MIDLTSKTKEEIDALIQKYFSILGFVPEQNRSAFAYAIDVSYNYLKSKELMTTDWKTWAVVVVKYKFNDLKNDSDIIKLIDDFIEYYDVEYFNYCENTVACSEFDRDCAFTRAYIKKIGS